MVYDKLFYSFFLKNIPINKIKKSIAIIKNIWYYFTKEKKKKESI